MFGRLINLPFKVLGTVARVVQEHDAAKAGSDTANPNAPERPFTMSLDVPADFDPGPIRANAKPSVAEEVWLLDVRDQAEWDTGHARSAHHIPAPEIGIRLAELPPDTRIVVMGRTAAQTKAVVRFLRFRGLDDTWCLHGGLTAWTRAGGAITNGGTP
jgi:rhodanese-related sulfurtransferase